MVRITPGSETNDEATSSELQSTESTVSDDEMLPVHVTNLHGWLHAVDGSRPALQQPNLTQEFQAFREEMRAELQAQAQRIECFIANYKNVGEVVAAERTYFSAQVSTLRAEGAQEFYLLKDQMESYASDLDALSADFDDRIQAAQSMLTSKFEQQAKQEAPKLLDKCLLHEVLCHMEQHICAELLGHVDEVLACEAAAHQQLERKTTRKFDTLFSLLQDKSRDKQKPVAMDVVEQELLVASSASSSRGALTMGADVPEGYEVIDQTTAVPADKFERLAMAGRVARNGGQRGK